MPTTTTNYALNLPTVGSDDDQWGSYLNTNFTKIDTELKTLNDSIADQDLEELGNVVNTTPAEDQVLQFNGQNWSASTLSISDISGLQTALDDKADDSDLTGITTNPADGSITYAKLNTALQVQVDRILLTDDDASPTDNQILKYSATDAEWQYADLPGSTVQTLSDVNTASLADDALLVYNSTAGEFQFESGATLRTTLGVDASGTDNSTPVTLSGSLDYLTLSGQAITLQQVNLTTDVTDTLPVASGGTGSATASDARTALGLQINVNTQAFDAGLQSISGLTTAANKMIYTTASDTYAVTDLTAFARTILDDADAAAVQATLSLVPGTDIQAYDADTAKYDDTTANFTGTLQNGGSNVVVNSDIGSTVEAYSATNADYGDTTANFTGTLQNGGSNVVVDSDINSTVQAYDAGLGEIAALAVTDGNFIVGNGTTWVAESGATARESLGLTIGTDVQAYDADTAKYDDTTANFTGALQNGGSNVVVDSDIGSSVQGYDADTAKYDDTTANFTGTLQNGGSNVVVDSDIGSSVQAYDADLSTIAGLSSADGNFIVGSATGWVVESGATVRTSLGLAIGTDVQAYDANTAKLDATTSNFTGTLQNGGSNVLVDSDIGSTVQAAGSYLTSVDLTSNVGSTVLPVANGGTGVTGLSSLDAADLGSNNGVTDATGGYVLTADGTGGTAWEAATGGISDVVSDTTPQLGGNLDVNGNSIVSASAGNIIITPDTTGKIILDGLSWPTADGSADQVLKTDGSGNLSFVDQSGGGGSGSAYIEHSSTVSDSLAISSGTNRMYVGNTSFSGSGTMAGYLVISHGYANFTGTVNIDTTGTLNVVS